MYPHYEAQKAAACDKEGKCAYVQREERNVWIAVVDIIDNGDSSFSRPGITRVNCDSKEC
jgi:hypothetical protein